MVSGATTSSRTWRLALASGVFATLLVGLPALTALAQTTPITYTSTFSPQDTAYGGTPTSATPLAGPNGDYYLELPQYNPASNPFATLTSVSVSWQGSVAITYSFINNTTTNTDTKFYATITGTATLFTPTTTLANSTTPLLTSTGTFTDGTAGTPPLFSSEIDLPTTGSFQSGTQTPVAGLVTSNPSPFTLYTGSGNLFFDVVGSGNDGFDTTVGSVSAPFTDLVGGTATIVYTLTGPVPEPGALALMGIGVVTGALFLRRRKLAMPERLLNPQS